MSTTQIQGQLRCKKPGCLKYYNEEQNTDQSCHHHSGQPIFHDTKKGWTCCNKLVYDWDQFQKLPTCAVARHSDKKQDDSFYKSSTVINAATALKKQEKKTVVIKDITQYNKVVDQKKQLQEVEKAKQQKKPFKTKEGKLRCINQGCRTDYLEEQNHEDACGYHKGQAIFHDLKKFWNCCNKQTHDWDEFMKLPACCRGWHSPKLI